MVTVLHSSDHILFGTAILLVVMFSLVHFLRLVIILFSLVHSPKTNGYILFG